VKRLRRLRQHDALPRNRGGNQRDVFRQAGALHFLHRINRRDAQDGRAAGARLGDDALHLLARDERPHRVVHQHDFRFRRDLGQRAAHGLLPGGSAAHPPHRPASSRRINPEILFRRAFRQRRYFLAARGDEEVGDGLAFRQPPQREEHQRRAIQLEELLGHLGAHAGAESGGGQYGGDASHKG